MDRLGIDKFPGYLMHTSVSIEFCILRVQAFQGSFPKHCVEFPSQLLWSTSHSAWPRKAPHSLTHPAEVVGKEGVMITMQRKVLTGLFLIRALPSSHLCVAHSHF